MSCHSDPTVETAPAEATELPSASIATFHTTPDQVVMTACPCRRGCPGSTDTHRTRPRTTPSAARRHAHSGKYERPSPEPGVRDAQIAPKRVQVGGGGASSSSI